MIHRNGRSDGWMRDMQDRTERGKQTGGHSILIAESMGKRVARAFTSLACVVGSVRTENE